MKRVAMVLVVLALVVLGAVALIPVAGEKAVAGRIAAELEKATGFAVEIDGVKVKLLRSRATLSGIRFLNGPGFEEGEALAIRELYVRYKPLSLLGREVILPEVILDVDHVTVVRDAQGKTNLDPLMGDSLDQFFGAAPPVTQAPPSAAIEPSPTVVSEAAGASDSAPEPGRSQPAKDYRIDSLTLKLNRMEVVDYARGGSDPQRIDLPVQFRNTYEDVTDLEAVSKQAGLDLALQAAPAILGQGLMSLLGDTPDERRETLKELEGQVKDFLKAFR